MSRVEGIGKALNFLAGRQIEDPEARRRSELAIRGVAIVDVDIEIE